MYHRLKSFSTFIFIGLLLGLTGCANASLSTQAATKSQILAQQKRHAALSNPANDASQKVLGVYRHWAGTRYRLGGTTKEGIDCSAFVKTTMHSAFNLHLPRSTAEQKHTGRAISKSALRPGDLVFFRNNHHVGVYIGGGKFVHASTSRGVMTSSLSERYWARNYTQSRRVL
ncbi:peptidase C40 [Muribacter muris]|uniref:Peptidase C40 n=1 Tax=Muribacter muris TaxID=67855 RepID=A0A4Y9JT45_9PAST|nr:NlpC/P60 family protein [Muribacter muris]MBF0786183.1 C40 family peptidase [Muribacter muris]MBF0826696.1 C40 family peptidase [Muribacter muris]TFV07677.1 peptidase C40 [Muribacter muris]